MTILSALLVLLVSMLVILQLHLYITLLYSYSRDLTPACKWTPALNYNNSLLNTEKVNIPNVQITCKRTFGLN